MSRTYMVYETGEGFDARWDGRAAVIELGLDGGGAGPATWIVQQEIPMPDGISSLAGFQQVVDGWMDANVPERVAAQEPQFYIVFPGGRAVVQAKSIDAARKQWEEQSTLPILTIRDATPEDVESQWEVKS